MQRIVLKVGSAVLTQNGSLALERLENLVQFISELKTKYEVILVTSGAVAAGYTALKLDKKVVANKQALASIGQPMLMKEYQKRFQTLNLICSQLLLTADDFDSRKRTIHAKNAIEILLGNNIIPIINENDVTATDELVFGDNDQLAAHVTFFFEADMLVILTDIDGYYDDNPHTNPNA
ncbi:MAG: glutamate 5-kinase, partial [Arcobacteraceae bacterium]|nr:glutamate 5-kinase [Arcobacteraceae bacterium]